MTGFGKKKHFFALFFLLFSHSIDTTKQKFPKSSHFLWKMKTRAYAFSSPIGQKQNPTTVKDHFAFTFSEVMISDTPAGRCVNKEDSGRPALWDTHIAFADAVSGSCQPQDCPICQYPFLLCMVAQEKAEFRHDVHKAL